MGVSVLYRDTILFAVPLDECYIVFALIPLSGLGQRELRMDSSGAAADL
jgi:hypothetical protein